MSIFKHLVIAAVALTALFHIASPVTSAAPDVSNADQAPLPATGQRMNLVFLLVDDWRGDGYSAAGNTLLDTPNIDRLAAEGVDFRNSFVPTSVCAPNRASILTGQHVRTHGVADFGNGFTPEQFEHLYPSLLWDAGYRTGFIGKWGVAATGNALAEAAEHFDYWAGVEGQGTYWPNGKDGKHATAIFAEQAAEFIRTTDDGQPFALSLSFKAAHGPWHEFDPRFADAVDEADVTLPETLTDAAFVALPERVRASRAGREGANVRADAKHHRSLTANYYRLIAGVDAAIGDIRAALQAAGHADDTLIILTGDNGHFLHEHGLHGKWLMYEPSLRVPMIVFDPRLDEAKRGQVRAEFVDSLDIAPTLLDAAGLPIPHEGLGAMAGQSLLPLVHGTHESGWDNVHYYEYTFQPWPGDIPKLIGVRTPRWKYVRYVEDPVIEQLFDLDADPLETRDLAADPGVAGTLTELRRLTDERRDAIPDRFSDYDVKPGYTMVHTAQADTTGTPFDLSQHTSVGQTFTAEGVRLTQVSFVLPVWRHPEAPTALDVQVRRDGPGGELLARGRVDRQLLYLVNTQRLELDVPTRPGETLYLQASPMGSISPGRIGWWKFDDDPYPGGTAYLGSQPAPASDLAVSFAFESPDEGGKEGSE